MLDLVNITKTFHPGTPNEVRALRGVTLHLARGSFLIIIGTNGSGKSTLLNAVAGSFLVDAGQLTLAGHSITRWAEHKRAQLIGRVFQNPFSGTAPTMSIAENLAMAARRGLPRGLGWALNSKLRRELRDRIRRRLAEALLASEAFFLSRLAIGQQQQEVAADHGGVDVEDILP